MSDTDEAADLEAARNAMRREAWYTAGWREYLRGRPEPLNGHAAAGWRDAKHARESCGRHIAWSMPLDSREKIWNDIYPKCY